MGTPWVEDRVTVRTASGADRGTKTAGRTRRSLLPDSPRLPLLDWPKCDKLPSVTNTSVPETQVPVNQNSDVHLLHLHEPEVPQHKQQL